ncbi:MAG: ABC transporter substrate-binding protein [Desulfosalsimonadaceae bacterium]
MKKLIVALFILLLMANAAFAEKTDADAPEAAEALLKKSIESVFDVLKNEDLTSQEQKAEIEAIVDPVFNYELIARLSLGRRNWSRLDPEQREVFVERFVTRLKDSYFENIAMIQGDAKTEIDYGEREVENGRVHVPVRAGMKDSSVDMRYKLHFSEGEGWRVYDVEINGVSIVASYRSQFNQVLSSQSVDEMLEALKTLEAPEVE